jgi:hypothetical protein
VGTVRVGVRRRGLQGEGTVLEDIVPVEDNQIDCREVEVEEDTHLDQEEGIAHTEQVVALHKVDILEGEVHRIVLAKVDLAEVGPEAAPEVAPEAAPEREDNLRMDPDNTTFK